MAAWTLCTQLIYSFSVGKCYVSIKTHATSLNDQNYKVLCTEQINYCNHEKVDSRMFYHLLVLANPSIVAMRANILTRWSLQWHISSSMTFHWNCVLKWEPSQKIPWDILVLIRCVKNLFQHNATRYWLIMTLQGGTTQRHLKRKTKLLLLNCL